MLILTKAFKQFAFTLHNAIGNCAGGAEVREVTLRSPLIGTSIAYVLWMGTCLVLSFVMPSVGACREGCSGNTRCGGSETMSSITSAKSNEQTRTGSSTFQDVPLIDRAREMVGAAADK